MDLILTGSATKAVVFVLRRKNQIDHDQFQRSMDELQEYRRKHSNNWSLSVLADEWGIKNVKNLTDDALARISHYNYGKGFQGRITAEIERRKRKSQNLVLIVASLTLLATIVGILVTIFVAS